MNTPTSDTFVSLVAPLHQAVAWCEAAVNEIASVLQQNYANYEILLVDDGSTDGTAEALSRLVNSVDCVRVIRLSRHFGIEAAMLAGFDSAIGDYIVVLQAETDPPALIPELVNRCRRGTGMVVGTERHLAPRSWIARLGSEIFHWYCRRFLGLEFHRGSRYFRVFSRAALNAVLQVKDRVRNLRHVTALIGFQAEAVPYDPMARCSVSPQRNLLDDIHSGFDVILANSRHPLRAVTLLGLLASGLNLLYLGYIVAVYFFKEKVAEGWTTLSLQQAVMFFLVFVCLTLLAEYVGLVLWETRDRPAYFVATEQQSSVTIRQEERRNVVRKSE
ncbi:MAG: glycosyltransferase [Pedosphaera sp.]|nr:glycosyltransferase [Pedosphaera sp.]